MKARNPNCYYFFRIDTQIEENDDHEKEIEINEKGKLTPNQMKQFYS
jgi:hypothetical protein